MTCQSHFSRLVDSNAVNVATVQYDVNIVTWMARALLGNGPVNTPRPNTHKETMEDVSQGGMLLRFAGQQRANEDAD
jgi:hypothetical protein